MANPTVRLLISGMAARTVELVNGETLADLRERLSGGDIPFNRIETLYLNGQPVSNPANHTLTTGDVIAGAPKLEGGL